MFRSTNVLLSGPLRTQSSPCRKATTRRQCFRPEDNKEESLDGQSPTSSHSSFSVALTLHWCAREGTPKTSLPFQSQVLPALEVSRLLVIHLYQVPVNFLFAVVLRTIFSASFRLVHIYYISPQFFSASIPFDPLV